METFWANRELKRQHLDKIAKQSKLWSWFGIISILCLISFVILGLLHESYYFQNYSNTILIANIIVLVIWWGWTIYFIKKTAQNQKEIYNILELIAEDIQKIKINRPWRQPD